MEDEMKCDTMTNLRNLQEMEQDENSVSNNVTDLVEDTFGNDETL